MGKKKNVECGPGEKLLRLFALLLFTSERYSLTALADIQAEIAAMAGRILPSA